MAEHNAANLAIGSVDSGTRYIRRLSAIEKIHNTKGYTRIPVTLERLEHANHLASVFRSLKPSATNFGRFSRGLHYLRKGLREQSGQDRLHQFVRALEALILPDQGATKRQFVHRCQQFAQRNSAAVTALEQSYDMRCDAEHVHDWDRSLQNLGSEKPEDVASWRVRQMEALASFAYDRILSTPALLQHFKDDVSLAAFWKLPNQLRTALWGTRLDISAIPIVRGYD